jgi:hypothetical protein
VIFLMEAKSVWNIVCMPAVSNMAAVQNYGVISDKFHF